MSGLEVAGLGIEAYNDGLDPVKSFMRWERELPQLIRKLRNQHVHYAQTIRILLEPIANEFELAELLQEPNGQLWKGNAMAKKLGDRLGESYHAYQGTIGDIERITKKIASKLDLDRAAELTKNDLEAMLVANPKKGNNERFEFRKRVRFGMSKKSIKALLEELDDCNKELERFTDKSERLETIRRKATKPSFASRIQRIQKYATTLHETLSTCWSCSCQSSHTTSLQLDHRSNLYSSASSKKLTQSSKTHFKVSFSSDSNDSMQQWSWQAAEILVEEEEEDTSVSLHPPKQPSMRKSVSFGNKPPPPYSLTDPTSAGAEASPSSLQEVKDLCASIQQLHATSPCIGFSFDTKNKLRGAYTVDIPPEKHVAPSAFISLEQLLDIKGRAKLNKKERYSLALTLASSTLQLNATPWFKDQWCAKDILFLENKAGTRLADMECPYVLPKGNEVATTVKAGPKRGFQNKNTVLLALAVSLLELYFGVSAEKHRELEEQPAGAFNVWALCAMAYEWADEEQENLSAAFSGAVSHCLRCFNDPSSNLQDVEFLQAAVECIVLPLQEELHQFLGTSGA